MSSHVESIMVEAEEAAKSRTTRSFCGHYEFVVEDVTWRVRDAASLLWTRDGKRISRKKAAQQIGELLQ